MRRERCWAAALSAEQFADERLYAHEWVTLTDAAGQGEDSAWPGDPVALVVAGEPPLLFGLGRVRGLRGRGAIEANLTVSYTHRLLDEPLPVPDIDLAEGLTALAGDDYQRLAGRVAADRRVDADKRDWLVSLALPIEAASAAEAVREFWTHVAKLGPRELPAFVWPAGDELAMQAYVLGEETNLDPEEDAYST